MTLTPEETAELERRLAEYPDWYKEEGRVEEIENLLALRELKLLPPLTIEDVAEVQRIVAERFGPQ